MAAVIQRAWRRRTSRRTCELLKHLRGLSVCCVCGDESIKMLRCSNAHGCCIGCAAASTDTRCPLCRENKETRWPDGAVPLLLRQAHARLRCHACGTLHRPDSIEHHRAWCPSHAFVCPYPACAQCVPARSMFAHVAHHDGVMHVGADGLFCVLGPVNGTMVLRHERTIVMLRVLVQRRPIMPSSSTETPPVHFQMVFHAYYESDQSPPLRATVRQRRLAGCDVPEAWVEEHRLGVVPPVLAHRETIVSTTHMPSLVPRAMLLESFARVHEDPMFKTSRRDMSAVPAKLRFLGVRDFPDVQIPYMPCDPFAYVALVDIHFEEERTRRIGDLYTE